MSTYQVRPIEEYELDSWDAFVSETACGTLYHTSTWRRAINHAYGEGQYQCIAVWCAGEIVGGFCSLVRKRLGVLTAVTPLATPYTGFLFGAAADAEARAALVKYVRRFRFQHLQCAPGLSSIKDLEEAGYTLIPRRTLEMNLRLPEEELWNSFDSNVRRNIRKAQKAEFDITDQWDEAQCYRIFSDTFERTGSACPVSSRWFQELADGQHLSSYQRRYVAWQNGKPMSFLVALNYEGRVYYQLAGTSNEARATGISSLLIWEMLRDHLDGTSDVFDFVGGNTPSISRFKEGFNPTVRAHFSVELNLSRRITWGRSMRDFIRRK